MGQIVFLGLIALKSVVFHIIVSSFVFVRVVFFSASVSHITNHGIYSVLLFLGQCVEHILQCFAGPLLFFLVILTIGMDNRFTVILSRFAGILIGRIFFRRRLDVIETVINLSLVGFLAVGHDGIDEGSRICTGENEAYFADSAMEDTRTILL